ncbi:lin1 family protein [Moniliophthora roreri]|nr:lin1 family protein [Moniliophthora roreri]
MKTPNHTVSFFEISTSIACGFPFTRFCHLPFAKPAFFCIRVNEEIIAVLEKHDGVIDKDGWNVEFAEQAF